MSIVGWILFVLVALIHVGAALIYVGAQREQNSSNRWDIVGQIVLLLILGVALPAGAIIMLVTVAKDRGGWLLLFGALNFGADYLLCLMVENWLADYV